MFFLGPIAIATIILQGLLFGGILSLIAVGLTLIFGISRVMNLAHGDFLFLGGVVVVLLFSFSSMNPILGAITVVPLFALIGAGFGFFMRKPMSVGGELSVAASVLVTLGLSSLIENVGGRIAAVYGFNYFAIPTSGFDIGTLNIVGITMSGILVVAFVGIVLISLIMSLLIYRTDFGSLMRATMADLETATMLGADIRRVSTITFAIGIALAALAGGIEVMVTSLSADLGLVLTVYALTVVVLGGLGSFYGALIGGFLIGVAGSVVEVVLDTFGLPGGAWSGAVPLVILILILIIKPAGLLRR